jgi:hypothetical protein
MDTGPTVAPTDILTFRFISAYLVEGLQPPTAGPILLYSDASQKVLLTDNSYEAFHHFDTVGTINYITATSIFHARVWDFSQFRTYVSARTQERLQHYGGGAFLIVEASHKEEAASIGMIGQSDERDFCCARPNGFRDKVEAMHKEFLEQSQAFVAFAMPSVVGFQDVGSCILANHPSGKPLYILSAKMSAMPTLATPIPADGPELCTKLFTHSTTLADFQTVFRLSAGSASNRRDNLRAVLVRIHCRGGFRKQVLNPVQGATGQAD